MNTAQLYQSIDALRKEAAAALPKGEARRINNFADKIAVSLKRYERRRDRAQAEPVPVEDMMTAQQIADRYIAKQAIFQALVEGRRLSLLNSKEFKVSEMHTQIHCIRRDIEDHNLPYTLRDAWITCGLAGKRCKEYWLEDKEGAE